MFGASPTGLKEISFKNIFIDGTKIEANANRCTFVWVKAVEKNMEKLKEKIAKELPEIAVRYGLAKEAAIEAVMLQIKTEKEKEGIKFVHGKEQRKTQLQRDSEKLTDYKERMDRYKESMAIFAESKRKSYSETDHNAAFMRIKTETQFFLIAFAFNVLKLWNRQKFNRFNKPLFEKMIA